MDGDRIVIGERAWVKQVTEHWAPTAGRDGPSEYSVTFYEPGDPYQWVCSGRIAAEGADLSPEGLSRIFRRAELRSWRDPSGTYWKICTCSTRKPAETGGDDGADILSFRRRDESGSAGVTRHVRGLRPLGYLSDEELQEILGRA